MINRWSDERETRLKKYWARKDLSAQQIADKFGDTTRDAVLGKIFRLGLSKKSGPRAPYSPRGSVEAREKKKQRARLSEEQRKAKRWAEKRIRAERAKAREHEKKIARARLAANGASRTSVAYRKHMPKFPDMNRNQLRAIIAQAVANTAAMQ